MSGTHQVSVMWRPCLDWQLSLPLFVQQAQQRLSEQEQQSSKALQEQAAEAATVKEAAVAALRERHEKEVGC